MKRFMIAGAIIFAFSILLGFALFYHYLTRPYGNTATVEIHIAKGTPTEKILITLVDSNVLQEYTFFKAYLLLTGKIQRVRAGDYIFQTPISPLEVARLLQTGDFKTYIVTLVEGWNLVQVAQYLEAAKLTNAEIFLEKCRDPALLQSLGIQGKSLEGYLYPDTYEIYYPQDATELIEKFVGRFWEVYPPEWRQRTQDMGWSVAQVVTLASIVEKETGVPEERPLIASVFHNRLKKNMRLEADPTVIYGIPNFTGNLTRRHLETPSPYNTYLLPGLPAGPIANPGKASLEAVLSPPVTRFLYFVSKNDGSHYFSTNLRDHSNAVQKYQIRRNH